MHIFLFICGIGTYFHPSGKSVKKYTHNPPNGIRVLLWDRQKMLIMVPNFFTKSLIGNSVYVIVKAEEVANFCVFLEIESYCSCVHTTSEIAVL